MRGVKYYRGLLLVLAALLLLTGCPGSAVQANSFTQFKTATASLVESTDTSYDAVDKLWDDASVACLVKYGDGTRERILNIVDDGKVNCAKYPSESFIYSHKRELGVRLQALKILLGYATKLEEVSAKDYATGIESATGKLKTQSSSVIDAASGFLKNLDKVKEAVGGIVDVAGKVLPLYVEHKREQALRKELSDSQKDVAKLAAALMEDHNAERINITAYRNSYGRAEARVLPTDEEKRPSFYETWVKDEKSRKQPADDLDALDVALKALPAAHAELRQSLEKQGMAMPALGQYVAAVEAAAAVVKPNKSK